jgi:acyl-coenzyme A synthetase/AMP-(fatty) acid ligase
MVFPLLDRIREHAEVSPIAPALISLDGCISYGQAFDGVVKIANHFDNLRLPRLSRALINIAHPDLRVLVFAAAIEYGLIPMVAQPSTLKEDFGWDLSIGSPDPVWPDVRPDVVVDQSVLTGRFADARRRIFAERGDDDLSYVTETSGTTGRPKLVAVTHRSHCEFFHNRWRRRFPPGARIATTTGSANKYGIRISLGALYDGATAVTVILDVASALRTINLFNATYLLTTPSYIQRAMDLMEMKGVRCPSINEIQLTGATFDQDLLRRIEANFAARIFVGYGTSEIEVGGIARGQISAKNYVKGYVGAINPELKLIVRGTRANPGAIVIVNDRDLFTRSIVKGKIVQWDQPFYTVPDIGFVENSALYVVGRADEVFNDSGNIKAYSLMAEEVTRIDRVKDVAIVSAASVGDENDIIIGVVADQALDLAGMPMALAQRLLMVGAEKHFRFVQLPEIPRNQQTGKVDRVALLKAYQTQQPDASRSAGAMREAMRR